MMKRNGHSVFEITRQVIRNFFNEYDERTTREFQQLIREAAYWRMSSRTEAQMRQSDRRSAGEKYFSWTDSS